MSAPANPALAAKFGYDLMSETDSFSSLGEEINKAIIYLFINLAHGGWSDYSEDHPIHEFVARLSCGPLFEPYFEEREWTTAELTALAVKHRLKS